MNNSMPPNEHASQAPPVAHFRFLPLLLAGLLGGGLVLGLRWLLDFWKQSTPVSQARVSIKPHTPIIIASGVYGQDSANYPQFLRIADVMGVSEIYADIDDTKADAKQLYKDWTIHVAKPAGNKQIRLSIRDANDVEQHDLTITSTTNIASRNIVLEPTVQLFPAKDGYNVSWVTLTLFGEQGKFALLEK